MVVEAVTGVMSLEDGTKIQKLRRTMKLIFLSAMLLLDFIPR